MSITALNHVLRLQIPRSSQKFVLVCLANYADDLGYCYPSINRLCEDTSLDRKTVIGSLDNLIKLGAIRDTKKRTGRTGQVIIYEILGIPELSTTHYVYRVTCPATGQFYLGKRSFNGDPEMDTYRGSSQWISDCLRAKILLTREILGTYSTSHEAILAEAAQFKIFDADPLCMNLGLPSKHRERSSPKNGTGSENGTVPIFRGNSTVIPPQQSRKRDTEPSVEPSRETKKRQPAATAPGYSPEMERFWRIYPKNNGSKKEAFKAFVKATNTGTTVDTIIAGANRYATHARINGTGINFIRHAATWLNQACWETEYSTAPPNKSHRPQEQKSNIHTL